MEDILLNSISLQIHQDPDLSEIPIYTDRVNQEFKVPAFYVYMAYAQSTKKRRDREVIDENVNYSFFILYKNGKDEMYQQDALNKYKELRRIFRYLNVVHPETGEVFTFQVTDVDLSFSDVAMTVTVRFKVPYRIRLILDDVKSLEHKIIVKEEN